ncbi:hypothetical protein L1987_21425 [Smallanthus sonchifolius]|uniref:Uncharacterized protein n=1 Tax=Smallanthus sonchifolius TaxID=185202 RepID=A0ACB9IW71_9ASTR|nr:hypothetical protein L1987_21425 [Smallanthus sonchifolius]
MLILFEKSQIILCEMLSENEDLKKRLLHGDIAVDTYEELLQSLLYPPAINHPIDLLPNLDMQVKNAMQMQLMVQKQLHEQLEELAVGNRRTTKETDEDDMYLLGLTWNFDLLISGMQFKDALQMQIAIQRQLHEQLEIHRNLQLRIEEQSKKLKMMYDQHQQDKSNKSQNLEIESAHDDHDSHES